MIAPKHRVYTYEEHRKFIRLLSYTSRGAAISVMLISGLVLIGWIINDLTLKSIHSSLPSMKANAAVALLCAGFAALLSTTKWRDKLLQKVLSSIVFIIGALTIYQYIAGVNLGIDQLLFKEAPNQVGTTSPGRMAPNTAVLFVFLGLSLLFLGIKVYGKQVSRFFLLLAALVLTPTVIGYIYQIEFIFGLSTYTKMALHTAMAFTLLLIAITLSRHKEGFMAIATSDTNGGFLARRLLALAIILPLFLGWIILQGQRSGLYDQEYQFLLLVVLYIFIFAYIVWRSIFSLYKIDIDRRAIAKTLEESEERYRLLLDNVRDYGIFLTDTRNRITSWNPGIQNIFGYTEEEFIGKSGAILFTPEDIKRKIPEKEIKIAFQKGAAQDRRWHIRKDGSRFFAEGLMTVVKDYKGKKIGYTKIIHDITSQWQAEEAQRQRAEILEGITDGFLSFDKKWYFTYLNTEGAKTLGRTPKELLGKNLWEEFPELERTEFGKLYKQAMKDGKPKQYEDFYAPFNAWFSVRVYPTKSGLSLFFQNITERKELERQKDEFLGVASHELKTPVTSIKAYTQILQQLFTRKGDTKSADLLAKMDGQINKLTTLISDLLDVTKIQAGKLQFTMNDFDFNKLVHEVVEEIQRTTDRHHIITELSPTKNVYGDRERIGQVITNFLTNAIKYSPHTDKIIVTTKASKEEITLCVQDFGVGIPKDRLKSVFERFYRVEEHKNETIPGLGLGLYISREIIERQRGKIWVESKTGEGSTFYFSLPIQKHGVIQEKNSLTEESIKHE